MNTVPNGKGSSPRNNYSKEYRNHYDQIEWKPKICLNCGSKMKREKKLFICQNTFCTNAIKA